MKAVRSFPSVITIVLLSFLMLGPAVQVTAVAPVIITVTNTADSGAGSLRAAIASANSGDTITFGGTAFASGGTITLTSGAITINKNLTITGTAGGVVIKGNGSDRVFVVDDSYTLDLASVTITGGSSAADGGGIYVPGGTLNLTGSTVTGNTATNYGGGIAVEPGTLNLVNSTISGNTSGYSGGGVWSNGSFSAKSSTITNNNCGWGGCGLEDWNSPTVNNTIIAGNNLTNGDDVCEGSTPITNGTNLIGVDCNGYFGGSDLLNGDSLLLGSLKNNGGPTKTHMPQSGSPAIDGATVDGNITVDQRGVARPINGDGDSGSEPDIGAVEVYPLDLAVTKTAGSSTVTPGQTITYTIVVSNNGPNSIYDTVTVTDTMPTSLTNVSWTCTASSGAVCPSASGTGDINETVDTLPSGNKLTYRVTGTVAANASGTIANTAKVTTTYDLDTNTTNSSATANVTVDTGGNSAPVASNQSVTTVAYNSVNITLSATDADGDSLTYRIVSQPQGGTLTGTAPNVTYTPDPGYTGSDTFTFRANDGNLNSNTATVSISVTPGVNTAPAANAQIIWLYSNYSSIPITLSGTDWDGDSLTYQVLEHGGGSVSGTPPNVTFSVNSDTRSNYLSFRVYDGTAYSAPAVIGLKKTTAPTNSPPAAHNQVARTQVNTPVPITLAGSDYEGDTINYQLVTNPQHGTLTGTPPSVTYTPAADYSGSDYFKFRTYTVETDYSSPAVVNIEVGESENMAPVADAGSTQTKIKTSGTITVSGSGSSDPDGSIVSYEWSEGGVVFANTVIADIDSGSINNVDRYFTLTVTDNKGKTSTDTVLTEVPAANLWTTLGLLAFCGLLGLWAFQKKAGRAGGMMIILALFLLATAPAALAQDTNEMVIFSPDDPEYAYTVEYTDLADLINQLANDPPPFSFDPAEVTVVGHSDYQGVPMTLISESEDNTVSLDIDALGVHQTFTGNSVEEAMQQADDWAEENEESLETQVQTYVEEQQASGGNDSDSAWFACFVSSLLE